MKPQVGLAETRGKHRWSKQVVSGCCPWLFRVSLNYSLSARRVAPNDGDNLPFARSAASQADKDGNPEVRVSHMFFDHETRLIA